MLCPNCQHWNEESSSVCEACGADLNSASQSSTPVSKKPVSGSDRPFTPAVVPRVGGVPTGASALSGRVSSSRDVKMTAAPYTGPRLELSATGSIFKLAECVLIGREDPDLHIDLEGYPDAKFISHQHAQLIRMNNKHYIEDLGSSNGTYVNERKLASGQIEPLAAGDVIRLGKLEMIYWDS